MYCLLLLKIRPIRTCSREQVTMQLVGKRYLLKHGYFLHQLPKLETPVRNQLSYKNKWIKTRRKMENYSTFFNLTTASRPFYRCPQLPEFAQWKNTYLTQAVFCNSVVAVAVNGLLLLITVPSNALVMFSILVQKRFQRTSFMIMLFSLSTTGKCVFHFKLKCFRV